MTPRTIALSLVSHTNVGKTTLARTLLGRDVGTVRDEAHVTEAAEPFVLVETPEGDRLTLWDTPGFGDSARLARRLAMSADPVGWFLSQVWDRFRDRPFWSSQQAVRNVRDSADIVLYLVNASEPPAEAGYVTTEIRVLDWIGKPVVVLLNQLGPPRAASEEAAQVQAWRSHLAGAHQVRAVLPLDAFARCWVQEATLLRTIETLLPEPQRSACARLIDEWLRRRHATFEASIAVLAERLARAATDREPLAEAGVLGRLREAGGMLRPDTDDDSAAAPGRRQAMRRLAERLDADVRAGTARLIALHGLEGHASGEVLARLAEHYAVSERLDEGKAAMWGGVVTGALTGLKADLATGGLTFGAGLLAGGIVGALGAFGLARGYNIVRGAQTSSVAWTDAVLDELAVTALLGYLAVAHYGRGRGNWTPSEHPPHWRDVVIDVFERRRAHFARIWALRGDTDAQASMKKALRPALAEAALEVLERLYPGSGTSARAPSGPIDSPS
ncbi:MAG: GTPase domain-containing protein [Burkholderiaceae bacterium]|nr:GTPase domain-containing protein [Burkholderiaceae bacterium]